MSHRDGEARARRHVRQRVRTIDTPSAATQHRATVARTQCSLTQQHQQLHVQHQQHLQQQQHLRHHRHQHVRARTRTHTRATTADPTPRPANSAGTASAHRYTLHCTRTTKSPAATLPLSFADENSVGSARRNVRSAVSKKRKAARTLSKWQKMLPLRRLCHATAPHGRPARALLVSPGYHTWAGHSDHRPTQHTVACVAQPATRRIPSPRPGPTAAAVPARLRPRPNASIGDHTDYLAVLPLRRP